MERLRVDVAVIGAGSAGVSAYHAAARLGKRAVLIDPDRNAPSCAATRRVASRLLFAAAETAHSVEDAEGLGIHASLRHIDGRALMKRIQAECERSAAFSRDPVTDIPVADLIHGHARFLNAHCLQVDDRIIVEAASVVVAAVLRTAVPEALAALNERLLTPDTLFELDTLPYSLAVIGTGPAGLALGQALHRLGVRVGLFESGSGFAGLSDPVVRSAAVRCVGEGMDVRRNVELLDARRDHTSAILRFKDEDGQEFVERFAYVLVADAASGPDICLTAPQIATAGTTFSHLPKQGYAVGEALLDIVPRGTSGRRQRGILRLYGEIGTGVFLGAEMVGPDAGHIAQLLSWAHRSGLSVAQILDMPVYGPAMDEGLRSALRSLQAALGNPVTSWSPPSIPLFQNGGAK